MDALQDNLKKKQSGTQKKLEGEFKRVPALNQRTFDISFFVAASSYRATSESYSGGS